MLQNFFFTAYVINKYFYYDDVFFLKINNNLFTQFTLLNFKNNFKNIESFSFRLKLLKLKNKKINEKMCIYDFKNYNDLAWALRIVYSDPLYIDYTKKFSISYGTDSSLNHYKICSIEFKWLDDELHIYYEPKDTFLLALLLEIYKSFLSFPDFMLFENAIDVFSDEKKLNELDVLNEKEIKKNHIILFFFFYRYFLNANNTKLLFMRKKIYVFLYFISLNNLFCLHFNFIFRFFEKLFSKLQSV